MASWRSIGNGSNSPWFVQDLSYSTESSMSWKVLGSKQTLTVGYSTPYKPKARSNIEMPKRFWILLSARFQTIQLLGKTLRLIGISLCDLELGSGFIDMTSKSIRDTRKNKKQIYWTISKLMLLYCKWYHGESEKTTHQMREIFENHITNKRFTFKICKELLQLSKRQITQFKRGQRIWIDISSKKMYK